MGGDRGTSVYGGVALQKAELGELFCKVIEPGHRQTVRHRGRVGLEDGGPGVVRAGRRRLPTTPEFKASLTGRYEFTDG